LPDIAAFLFFLVHNFIFLCFFFGILGIYFLLISSFSFKIFVPKLKQKKSKRIKLVANLQPLKKKTGRQRPSRDWLPRGVRCWRRVVAASCRPAGRAQTASSAFVVAAAAGAAD
jgi:hypothetical protein